MFNVQNLIFKGFPLFLFQGLDLFEVFPLEIYPTAVFIPGINIVEHPTEPEFC